jgi:hypothetical protein
MLERLRIGAAAAASLSAACTALAAPPNEIKVFTDELASYREHTLETHVNKARRGPLQLMPEYSYGIWRNWEVSLQLPLAFTSGSANAEGYRAELQYVAPHDGEHGFYWGINFELARSFLEIIPIVGLRVDRWHLAVNPGIERARSGQGHATTGTPAAKIAYRTFERNYFGLECYVEAGQSRTLYLAWDGKLGKSDINLGVGRGFTETSDRWVAKMIYEFAF